MNILITHNDTGELPVPVFVILLVSAILQVLQMIKKLHDIDMNGWYWLLSFIPLVNLGLGFMLLMANL